MVTAFDQNVIDWCRNNCSTTEPCDIKNLILNNIKNYIKTNNVPTIEISRNDLEDCMSSVQKIDNYPNVLLDNIFIKGIPFYSIVGPGIYFEMKPGVWRLAPSTEFEYDLFTNFLNLKLWYEPLDYKSIEKIVSNVYGFELFILATGLLKEARCVCSLQGILNFITHSARVHNYKSVTLQNYSVMTEIPKDCYFKEGLYIETLRGWRYVVKTEEELNAYVQILEERGD